jgi:hypothetical protein
MGLKVTSHLQIPQVERARATCGMVQATEFYLRLDDSTSSRASNPPASLLDSSLGIEPIQHYISEVGTLSCCLPGAFLKVVAHSAPCTPLNMTPRGFALEKMIAGGVLQEPTTRSMHRGAPPPAPPGGGGRPQDQCIPPPPPPDPLRIMHNIPC